MKGILSLLLLLCTLTSTAQIVTLDPALPTQYDSVTVTYDATKGSGGLVGVEQVYMHTGVVTNKSENRGWLHVIGNWGTDDERVKMINIGNDMHQLRYHINDFHMVPDDETVLELAFVFRNVDGSKEGKTAANGDIYVGIDDGSGELQTFFQAPEAQSFIATIGETIRISVISSQLADIEIADNGNLLSSATGVKKLDFDLEVTEGGNHVITYKVITETEVQESSFSFAVNPEVRVADVPSGIIDGINEVDDNSIVLSLYAPEKDFVYVIGDFNDWKVDTSFFMRSASEGRWWLPITDLVAGEEYGFQYLVDGEILIGDPYSPLILDSGNDRFIEESTYPGLRAFPEETTGQLTLFTFKEEEYDWKNNDYQRPEKGELIVYELLIRDFLEDHSYNSLYDTLDYLDSLGINAIELMPVNEYEGNVGWGYNPSYHMALDKYYGTRDAFKRFIDEAHSRGIAVIVDVVFNHAFSQSPLARLYWDSSSSRPSADNPWLNQDATHPFNVGYDFNHESMATKTFVKQVLQYMIEEYKLDGFRFDLSKGFTQVNNPDNVGAWSSYDASRISILKDYADFIWSVDDQNYVILEHFADNSEETELTAYGMMVWSNHNFNYNEGTMGYNESNKSDFSWISYKERGWDVPHNLAFMESHDEERLMYRNLEFGNSMGGYNVRDIDVALSRIEMAATFFIPIPGPKMIWQFGEYGYEFSINRCQDGSISENCRLDLKPIVWEKLMESKRLRLYETFSALNHLKSDYEVFKTDDFTMDVKGASKSITLRSADQNVLIVGNWDVEDDNLTADFPGTGTWYEFFSGETMEVTDVTVDFSLSPGEYKLYTDFQLPLPDITSSIIDSEIGEITFNLFPNPSSNIATLVIDLPQSVDGYMNIYNMEGKLIHQDRKKWNEGENKVNIPAHSLYTGQYIVHVVSDAFHFSKLFLVE